MCNAAITSESRRFQSNSITLIQQSQPLASKSSFFLLFVPVQLFTDGITNKLIGCFHSDSRANDEVLLVRIYGNKTDLLIDRNAEKINIAFLHRHGLAPQLYATFNNGLVYEFVPGVTLNVKNVLESRIWRLVAENMARMHKLPLSPQEAAKEPMLKTKTIKFLDLIPETFSDPEKHERYYVATAAFKATNSIYMFQGDCNASIEN